MLQKVIALSAAVAAADTADRTVCNALAMSGGGSRGSYEAGALWGMYYSSEEKTQFQYDVITGVSAGAINLAAMGVYEKGQEVEMLQDVSDRWSHLAQNNLYERWFPFGIVTGIHRKTGVLNTEPLEKYIGAFLDEHGS